MENNKLKFVVEKNVPFLEALDGVAHVVRLPSADINREAVRDADGIVVRTRNHCDASLLSDSKVSLIATATIGTDHIDMPWCAAHGIEVANAPGSNAPAVAQYVFSSLMRVINRPLSSYILGIVGVGHVGSIVDRWARSMGIKTMLCDPPRQALEGGEGWCSLDELARGSDIISFHTPLVKDGPYPTYHLADSSFFKSLRRAPVIINSSRGAVVDNDAWIEAIEAGVCGPAIIDCWEGEPFINRHLLQLAAVATPHIAGYSFQGKQRASQMALDAICRHFALDALRITGDEPAPAPESITPLEAIRSYDPLVDTSNLKSNPGLFEQLRNSYCLRSEPSPCLES